MRALLLSLAATLAAPGAALACGGLFCDNAQPVNQAAERILFARAGETMHMIVRLTYDGPPVEFGWLLPAPADVETAVSSEALFQFLDQRYAPLFRLTTQIDPRCQELQARNSPDAGAFEGGGAGGAGGGGGGGPDVQILSREAVGPYDRTILQAASVEDLTTWLRDNGYQFPEGSEDRLRPYVELGSAFVALKLLPGAQSDDVLPLHLTFT
ncbi:MAG: DUF2330 domain-containing protein, partial [Myxococcales bacterium]|nr:DUF2330 domain-containing protein [Myxococcales bacterium]